MEIKALMVLGCMMLVGCASNQQFDCPVKGGIRCQSMREIEDMIDAGKLSGDKHTLKTYKKTTHSSFSSSLRSPEEVVEVWIAPYESNEGIYHHSTVVNMVLKPAEWHK